MSRAIVFDLDGTLVDSLPDIHAAVSETLAEDGLPPLPVEVLRGFVGNGVAVLVERVARHIGRTGDAADMLARFRLHYRRAPAVLTRPYPGVLGALEALRAQGHALALCTNKPEAPARAILDALGLASLLPVVVGGDTLSRRKPDPAPLRACLATLAANGCIFVGDSEVDAQTAGAAGTRFALFTEGYRRGPVAEIPHDAAFSHFADLPGTIARLG